VVLPQEHWTVKGAIKAARALIGAGNDLCFAAETTGGVAGRDAALCAAIAQWAAERDKQKQVLRIIELEGDSPEIGAGAPDHPLRAVAPRPEVDEGCDETGWLIECGKASFPLYWTGRTWGEWSGDHQKACRFARREDAFKVSLAIGDSTTRPNEHRIVEHAWIAGTGETLTRAPGVSWPGDVDFPLGCAVRKASGPEWRGKVVGYYSSSFTPEGLVIECTWASSCRTRKAHDPRIPDGSHIMSAPEQVQVTQADRDAAVPFMDRYLDGSSFADDANDLAKAFARHRHTAQSDLLAAMREAREALNETQDFVEDATKQWPAGSLEFENAWAVWHRARAALAKLTAAIDQMGGG
jgi:hypothetical protein